MGSISREDFGVKQAQKLVPSTIKARYEQPSDASRLFLFDYDGTLTPIISNPDLALPTELALNTLAKLTEPKNNAVWIISGRDQAFLEKQWGHIKGLGLR
jgi:trehalose-6-phosphatase